MTAETMMSVQVPSSPFLAKQVVWPPQSNDAVIPDQKPLLVPKKEPKQDKLSAANIANLALGLQMQKKSRRGRESQIRASRNYRLRKKEYIKGVEKLAEQLSVENQRLKQLVSQLLMENQNLRSSPGSSPVSLSPPDTPSSSGEDSSPLEFMIDGDLELLTSGHGCGGSDKGKEYEEWWSELTFEDPSINMDQHTERLIVQMCT